MSVLGHDGERLARLDHLAYPLPAGAFKFDSWQPLVGDANGDGRDDIAVEYGHGGHAHTLLCLQEDGGKFSPVVLGDLLVLAFAQLDDDAADELIVNVAESERGTRVWVVGAGEDELAPASALLAPPRAAQGHDDPAWDRTGRHAKTLQGLGLVDEAASEFADLGRRASRPASRALAYYAAGVLRERSGRDREAQALYRDAAQAPEFAADALQGAMRAQRLGDYEAALQAIAALQALPALDAGVRQALEHRRWSPSGVGTSTSPSTARSRRRGRSTSRLGCATCPAHAAWRSPPTARARSRRCRSS